MNSAKPSGRIFFHVDLDAFFASVEQLDHPEFRGRPVVVGAAPGGRGVVSTCSYEARAFGLHSAMPISEAFRRCPAAVFLPVRMHRYAQMSRQVMGIFGDFTPDVRPLSIDEAFLDMTGTEKLWGSPREAAETLKAKVRSETGLTISVGAAANAYVAKIASGLRKPDGLVIVEEGEEAEFMSKLPLLKLWGAGEKTQARFAELGIQSVAQLAAMSEPALVSLFGKAGGLYLHAASRGQDIGMFSREAGRRSMSSETTFSHDLGDRRLLESVLMSLSDELYYRLFLEGLSASCLFIKLRYHDFTTLSRRKTAPGIYRSAAEAFADALILLDSAWDGHTEIRLIGLGFANIDERAGAVQGELFDEAAEKRRKAERAMFEIEKRGLGELKRARVMEGKGSLRERDKERKG